MVGYWESQALDVRATLRQQLLTRVTNLDSEGEAALSREELTYRQVLLFLLTFAQTENVK